MPEWLRGALASSPDASPSTLAWRIGVALFLGMAVAGLYRWARRGESVQPTFLVTLILLSTLIAMATQIIGDNIARAFSLVGALSVVRFRTVVKDTQDTAFVIFAVVMGMSAGANHLAVGVVGLAILGIASLVLWPIRKPDGWQRSESTLAIRLASSEGVQAAAEEIIASFTSKCDLLSASTARQGSSLDLTYRVRLAPGTAPALLVAKLNLLEGLQSADLRRND